MLYVKDPSIRNAEYKDVLAGLSAVVCAFVNTPPTLFFISNGIHESSSIVYLYITCTGIELVQVLQK